MPHYLIYETENLINHKLYRGCHITDNEFDGYLGSGKIFKKALRKYGRDNFHRIILKYCTDIDDMIISEALYVDEDWVLREDTYNLKTGGLSYGVLCEESKQKISESIKRLHRLGIYDNIIRDYKPLSDEVRRKISLRLIERYKRQPHHRLGAEPWNKGLTGAQVAWNKGSVGLVVWSDESKTKVSNTLKARYATRDHHLKGVDPWNKGKSTGPSWNKGIPDIRVQCPHCQKMGGNSSMKRWHFDNCKKRFGADGVAHGRGVKETA